MLPAALVLCASCPVPRAQHPSIREVASPASEQWQCVRLARWWGCVLKACPAPCARAGSPLAALYQALPLTLLCEGCGWIPGRWGRMLRLAADLTAPLVGESMSTREQDRMLFDSAYAELVKELPEFLARALARITGPGMAWVRVPVGIVFVVGGFLSFLPVLGIELLPLGMLLLAHDLPVLQRPVGTATLWLVQQVRALKTYARSAWNTP